VRQGGTFSKRSSAASFARATLRCSACDFSCFCASASSLAAADLTSARCFSSRASSFEVAAILSSCRCSVASHSVFSPGRVREGWVRGGAELTGACCGLGSDRVPLLVNATEEWMEEVERVSLGIRSPWLRQPSGLQMVSILAGLAGKGRPRGWISPAQAWLRPS